MPASKSHKRTYIEPPRHDELPTGIAADIVQGEARDERTPAGLLCKGAAAVPAAGGRSRKGRTKLSHDLDGAMLEPGSVRRARFLRRALATEIAATVGGGQCGVAASLLIKFSAQKTAAAEEAFQRGDYETHRKLSESARMDVLYARETAAKMAEARVKRQDVEQPIGFYPATVSRR